jgi:hypothetical protein
VAALGQPCGNDAAGEPETTSDQHEHAGHPLPSRMLARWCQARARQAAAAGRAARGPAAGRHAPACRPLRAAAYRLGEHRLGRGEVETHMSLAAGAEGKTGAHGHPRVAEERGGGAGAQGDQASLSRSICRVAEIQVRAVKPGEEGRFGWAIADPGRCSSSSCPRIVRFWSSPERSESSHGAPSRSAAVCAMIPRWLGPWLTSSGMRARSARGRRSHGVPAITSVGALIVGSASVASWARSAASVAM